MKKKMVLDVISGICMVGGFVTSVIGGMADRKSAEMIMKSEVAEEVKKQLEEMTRKES